MRLTTSSARRKNEPKTGVISPGLKSAAKTLWGGYKDMAEDVQASRDELHKLAKSAVVGESRDYDKDKVAQALEEAAFMFSPGAAIAGKLKGVAKPQTKAARNIIRKEYARRKTPLRNEPRDEYDDLVDEFAAQVFVRDFKLPPGTLPHVKKTKYGSSWNVGEPWGVSTTADPHFAGQEWGSSFNRVLNIYGGRPSDVLIQGWKGSKHEGLLKEAYTYAAAKTGGPKAFDISPDGEKLAGFNFGSLDKDKFGQALNEYFQQKGYKGIVYGVNRFKKGNLPHGEAEIKMFDPKDVIKLEQRRTVNDPAIQRMYKQREVKPGLPNTQKMVKKAFGVSGDFPILSLDDLPMGELRSAGVDHFNMQTLRMKDKLESGKNPYVNGIKLKYDAELFINDLKNFLGEYKKNLTTHDYVSSRKIESLDEAVSDLMYRSGSMVAKVKQYDKLFRAKDFSYESIGELSYNFPVKVTESADPIKQFPKAVEKGKQDALKNVIRHINAFEATVDEALRTVGAVSEIPLLSRPTTPALKKYADMTKDFQGSLGSIYSDIPTEAIEQQLKTTGQWDKLKLAKVKPPEDISEALGNFGHIYKEGFTDWDTTVSAWSNAIKSSLTSNKKEAYEGLNNAVEKIWDHIPQEELHKFFGSSTKKDILEDAALWRNHITEALKYLNPEKI